MPKKPVNLDSPPSTHPFIWCLAVICTVVTLAVIVAGIVVFVGYLVIRPTVPFVKVTYAHLDQFDFDQTGLLTTKLTVVINAENDNQKAYATFSDFNAGGVRRGEERVAAVEVSGGGESDTVEPTSDDVCDVVSVARRDPVRAQRPLEGAVARGPTRIGPIPLQHAMPAPLSKGRKLFFIPL
ncbi:hypothetical protein V2J09_014747 [Rumex salicifolius]